MKTPVLKVGDWLKTPVLKVGDRLKTPVLKVGDRLKTPVLKVEDWLKDCEGHRVRHIEGFFHCVMSTSRLSLRMKPTFDDVQMNVSEEEQICQWQIKDKHDCLYTDFTFGPHPRFLSQLNLFSEKRR